MIILCTFLDESLSYTWEEGKFCGAVLIFRHFFMMSSLYCQIMSWQIMSKKGIFFLLKALNGPAEVYARV